MKKLVYLLIAVSLVLALVPTVALAHTADDPFVVDLLAGQTKDIGDVEVWNDADNLYVKFVSHAGCFLEVHLQVDAGEWSPDILTKKGNPIPGHFEYYRKGGCFTEHTFTISRSENGWGCDTELMIAAHAAMGQEEAMTFESNVGDTVYGPINSDSMPTDWGTAGSAVRAYNWIGYTRDLTQPDQIPLCTSNPYSSLSWSWGFGLNSTYSPDIPGVLWISTAANTEQWHVDSWRKVVESYEVPGYPIEGSVQVNADNYYVVSNGETIGSDDNIWNPLQTHTFYPVEGPNTLEFVTENWAQGADGDFCAQLANPNGVTYKGTVSYYAGGETAWGCGDGNCLDFPGKNWATYFEYAIQCQPVCPSITGNSANIELLDYLPSDVRVGALESDTKVRIWQEFLGPLPAPLEYDLDEGRSAKDDGPPTETLEIEAGEYVCSYYVHLDNVGPSSTVQHTGYVQFDTNVSGLIISGGNLGTFAGRDLMFRADDSIGHSDTTYPDDNVGYPPDVNYLRGFDVNYGDNLDDAVFSGASVNFTMWVVNAHDSFRIILPALWQ